MISAVQVTTGLYALLGAIGLWILLLLYRDYKIDDMRDKLFALRDELFLYGADHQLYRHPGYERLRDLMNGFIRFAHKTTFSRLLISIAVNHRFVPPEQRPNSWADFMASISDLPEDTQQYLVQCHWRMLAIIVVCMIQRMVVVAPLLDAVFYMHQAKKALGRANSAILVAQKTPGLDLLERQALAS